MARVLILMILAMLPGSFAAGLDTSLDKARRISGYLELKPQHDDTPRWESLAEENSKYMGPMYSGPGMAFCNKPGYPQEITTEKDLERWVQAMAIALEKEKELALGEAVTPVMVEQWLRKLNTSLYGISHLEVDDEGNCILHMAYTPESRVLAAFRNSGVIPQLEIDELAALEICAWWISENIKLGMPNGQKLQKVHDALIDTSAYCEGEHSGIKLLLQGKGSCVAYARATQLLLHMLRIDCRIVFGTPEMNHVWNKVEMNEEWYHLDTCWDDPVAPNPLRTYNYYLLTDDEMDCDHDWVNSELYAESPRINPWHFVFRHFARHASEAASAGYTLPRENVSIIPALYNMYLKSMGVNGDVAANMLGVELNRTGNLEKLLAFEEKKIDIQKDSPRKIIPLLNKKRKQLMEMKAPPARPRLLSEQEKYNKVRDARTFNELLNAYAEVLEGSRLNIQCAEDVEPWRMREFVNLSDIHKYAECYNAIYDEKGKTISLDLKYWQHIRILHGWKNKTAFNRLSADERKQITNCLKEARIVKKRPTVEERVAIACMRCSKGLRGKFFGEPMNFFIPGQGYTRAYNSQGMAQAKYVILNMLGIPVEIVHGRVARHEEYWVLARVNNKDWYHSDVYPRIAGCSLQPCCFKRDGYYLLMTDDETRKQYIWDREGLPAAVSQLEIEMRNAIAEEAEKILNEK